MEIKTLEQLKFDKDEWRNYWKEHFESLKSQLNENFEFLDFETLNEFFDFFGKDTRMGVYIIRNSYNDKVYVGRALNLKSRMKQHFNEDGTPTSKAPTKLLKDYYRHKRKLKHKDLQFSISVVVLEERELLNGVEEAFIYILRGKSWGYNRQRGDSGL